MVLLDELDRRFPGKILAIRRRIKRDPSFEELCSDYETALSALAYWQASRQPSEQQASDYCALIAEFEEEIRAALKA